MLTFPCQRQTQTPLSYRYGITLYHTDIQYIQPTFYYTCQSTPLGRHLDARSPAWFSTRSSLRHHCQCSVPTSNAPEIPAGSPTGSPTWKPSGRSSTCAEKTQDDLVHAEHDRSTRYRAQQMRCQSAVHRYKTLFAPDELEALQKAGVFLAPILHGCLTKARTHNLEDCQFISRISHLLSLEVNGKHTS